VKRFIGILAAMLAISTPALAQRGGGGGGDHKKDSPPPPRRTEPEHKDPVVQRVPERGPPTVATPRRELPGERRDFADRPGHPGRPHVDGVIWIGHDHGRGDARFRLQHPWAWGHFTRIGPSYRWHIRGGGPDRFSIGVGYFRVARWEYAYVNDWYWDRDEILFYDDPDADGWYVAYNVRLGTYVHVLYIGG